MASPPKVELDPFVIISAVKDIHRMITVNGVNMCAECGHAWECATMHVVEGFLRARYVDPPDVRTDPLFPEEPPLRFPEDTTGH